MQKKILLVLLLFAGGLPPSYAQLYATRTGRVSFYSAAAFEDIEAVNDESASVLNTATLEITCRVPVKSFRFKRSLMQRHFNNRYLASDKFPLATFTGKIADNSRIDFEKDGSYDVVVDGNMSIRGVTRRVAISVRITVRSDEITVHAQFRLQLPDYGVKTPAVPFVRIAKFVDVTFNNVLRKTSG